MPHLPGRPTPIVSRVTQTADLAIRRATADDWPQIWPIFREITVAGDTFVYDPQTDEATARSWWLAPLPSQTWLADSDAVLGSYVLGPNHGGPGAHIANGSYMVAASNGYAIKLYQDLGFETIGTVPAGFRHPEQGLVDLLIMFHPL
jgi:hypothetical protein